MVPHPKSKKVSHKRHKSDKTAVLVAAKPVKSSSSKKKRSKQKTVSLSSVSGGKFSASSKITKSQKKVAKMQNKGVSFTKETGFTVTGVTDACYVGHATFCQLQMKLGFYRVTIKELFKKMEAPIKNWLETSTMPTGDTVELWYKGDSDDASVEVVKIYTKAGTDTWEAIAQYFNTQIVDGDNAIVFTRIVYKQSGGGNIAKTLNLLYASYTIDVKASLKMQNTTAVTAGDEADAVNNVPLFGRSYYGKGTGCNSNRSNLTEVTFVANDDHGLIFKTGTVAAGLSEMPPAGYFSGCKGTGKIRIEPGHIKTSVLKHSQTYRIGQLTKYLFTGTVKSKDLINTGNYAFFGVEHMIKATATDPTISLKCEHNYMYSMTMRTHTNYMTDMKVEQNSYLTF